jgi:hypothetical protein
MKFTTVSAAALLAGSANAFCAWSAVAALVWVAWTPWLTLERLRRTPTPSLARLVGFFFLSSF